MQLRKFHAVKQPFCVVATGAIIIRHYVDYSSHISQPGKTTKSNMAGFGAFLKNAWNKEPVVLAACAIGLLAVTVPLVSPLTKYSGMMNAAVPYNYPVPVRNNGKMDNVPSHPCDPKGPNLDWIKSL
ncbi:NADH dehydrogenase [ubiquinone] 1 alpha subcomplex subunit 3-like [Salvelinus fontinalis]|uniref:NADH dehydrogenase [ubiquinone] 1 alpha subcomplex subunit 3-like n=1 Tax=Salvelinus fontinalis TaxID=8038 RepID=UPI002484FBC0|nr:NADH dehydrogenase [ubiquinone] 1 alpha subcomplex subunit 3-like [Salvelinus fontinalis]